MSAYTMGADVGEIVIIQSCTVPVHRLCHDTKGFHCSRCRTPAPTVATGAVSAGTLVLWVGAVSHAGA